MKKVKTQQNKQVTDKNGPNKDTPSVNNCAVKCFNKVQNTMYNNIELKTTSSTLVIC